MKQILDTEAFSKYIRYKRVVEMDVSMDIVAKQTGISKATLSRLEDGYMPEVNTFLSVCKWLGKPCESFAMSEKKRRLIRSKDDIHYIKK